MWLRIPEEKAGLPLTGERTRHKGYLTSQRKRRWVEEIFGWMKTIGVFRKTRFKGRDRMQLHSWFVRTAYDLLRITKLMPEWAAGGT
jgi:hypothetical protein